MFIPQRVAGGVSKELSSALLFCFDMRIKKRKKELQPWRLGFDDVPSTFVVCFSYVGLLSL